MSTHNIAGCLQVPGSRPDGPLKSRSEGANSCPHLCLQLLRLWRQATVWQNLQVPQVVPKERFQGMGSDMSFHCLGVPDRTREKCLAELIKGDDSMAISTEYNIIIMMTCLIGFQSSLL